MSTSPIEAGLREVVDETKKNAVVEVRDLSDLSLEYDASGQDAQ